MDFVSCAAVAGSVTMACIKISNLLHQFIEETKSADGNIKTFYKEVTALSRILKAIRSSLQHPSIEKAITKAQGQDDTTLWDSIQYSLDDCGRVVKKLNDILADIGLGARTGIFNSALTTYRLRERRPEMALLRQQIQTYSGVLQMAMQVISV